MSLFLNDEDPLVIDDDSKDDTVDLGPIVTATPHHHRGKSRKRHFPTRHGGAVKRKRLASPPSSSILLDNDIVVLDDEVVIPSEKPVVVTSTRIPPVPTQPDLADLILQGLDQSESVIPYEKPAPVAPKYHLPSDPDVSSYQVTSTTNQGTSSSCLDNSSCLDLFFLLFFMFICLATYLLSASLSIRGST